MRAWRRRVEGALRALLLVGIALPPADAQEGWRRQLSNQGYSLEFAGAPPLTGGPEPGEPAMSECVHVIHYCPGGLPCVPIGGEVAIAASHGGADESADMFTDGDLLIPLIAATDQ